MMIIKRDKIRVYLSAAKAGLTNQRIQWLINEELLKHVPIFSKWIAFHQYIKNILTAPFCIPSFIVELLQLVQEMA